MFLKDTLSVEQLKGKCPKTYFCFCSQKSDQASVNALCVELVRHKSSEARPKPKILWSSMYNLTFRSHFIFKWLLQSEDQDKLTIHKIINVLSHLTTLLFTHTYYFSCFTYDFTEMRCSFFEVAWNWSNVGHIYNFPKRPEKEVLNGQIVDSIVLQSIISSKGEGIVWPNPRLFI